MSVPEVKLLPSFVRPCKIQITHRSKLVIIFLMLASWSSAQKQDQVTLQDSMVTYTLPEFEGGMARLNRIITDNLEYPKAARKDRIGGEVIVGFYVDTTGKLSDLHIVKGVRADIDAEAIRLAGLLKKWSPGQMNGRPVRVKFQLPLTFIPEKRKKNS